MRKIVWLFAPLLLAACAQSTAPVGSGAHYRDVFVPAPHGAQIFHYRLGGNYGSGWSYIVWDNGNPVGEIGNGGFLRQEVEPGPHEYVVLNQEKISMPIPLLYAPLRDLGNAAREAKPIMEIVVEPGKTYYFRWEKQPRWTGDPVITPVSEEEALPEIQALREFPRASPGNKPQS